jgi:hypothetical protein
VVQLKTSRSSKRRSACFTYVDRRAIDAACVVDHKIAFALPDDIDDAADFSLQVVEASLASVKINYAYGFGWVRGHNKSIHMVRVAPMVSVANQW